MDKFQIRLKEALEKSGISQAELARRTHIGRNSISDYLKGKYEAKQDKVYALAHALNVNEAWLMGYDVSPTPSDADGDIDEALDHAMSYDGKPMDDHDRDVIKAFIKGYMENKK